MISIQRYDSQKRRSPMPKYRVLWPLLHSGLCYGNLRNKPLTLVNGLFDLHFDINKTFIMRTFDWRPCKLRHTHDTLKTHTHTHTNLPACSSCQYLGEYLDTCGYNDDAYWYFVIKLTKKLVRIVICIFPYGITP